MGNDRTPRLARGVSAPQGDTRVRMPRRPAQQGRTGICGRRLQQVSSPDVPGNRRHVEGKYLVTKARDQPELESQIPAATPGLDYEKVN